MRLLVSRFPVAARADSPQRIHPPQSRHVKTCPGGGLKHGPLALARGSHVDKLQNLAKSPRADQFYD